MIISIVPYNLLPIVWDDVKSMVKLAIDKSNGELTIDDLYAKLLSKSMLLVTVHVDGKSVAALTMEQREFDSGKRILHVATAGGEMASEWIEEVNELCDQIAIKYNCEEIYIIGREGWVRKLKHLNYSVVHTVISRKVGE